MRPNVVVVSGLVDEPLFVSPEGCAIRISNFHRNVWKPLLKGAGIALLDERVRRVTFNSLRHTAATAAVASGENVVGVASRMGHANPQVTLTVYAGEWVARQEHGAEGIAEVQFGISGSKTVAVDTQRLAAVGDKDAQVLKLAREGAVDCDGQSSNRSVEILRRWQSELLSLVPPILSPTQG